MILLLCNYGNNSGNRCQHQQQTRGVFTDDSLSFLSTTIISKNGHQTILRLKKPLLQFWPLFSFQLFLCFLTFILLVYKSVVLLSIAHVCCSSDPRSRNGFDSAHLVSRPVNEALELSDHSHQHEADTSPDVQYPTLTA